MAIGFTEVPSRPKGAFLGLAFNVRRAFETHYLAQPRVIGGEGHCGGEEVDRPAVTDARCG